MSVTAKENINNLSAVLPIVNCNCPLNKYYRRKLK